jgi:hypothetical protein
MFFPGAATSCVWCCMLWPPVSECLEAFTISDELMSDTIDERAMFGLLESNPLISRYPWEEVSSARVTSDSEEVRRALDDSRAGIFFDCGIESYDDDVSMSVGVE